MSTRCYSLIVGSLFCGAAGWIGFSGLRTHNLDELIVAMYLFAFGAFGISIGVAEIRNPS